MYIFNDKEMLTKIANVLIHQAKHKGLIYYSGLAQEVGMSNPRNLDRPLGQLSDICKVNGLPLISAIVIPLNGDPIPSAGYFKYFFPNLPRNKWEKSFIEERNKVYQKANELVDLPTLIDTFDFA